MIGILKDCKGRQNLGNAVNKRKIRVALGSGNFVKYEVPKLHQEIPFFDIVL